MKVTPDIIKGEFIGTEGTIIKSQHPSYIGISGKVADESKNTFTIMEGRNAKNIIKEAVAFRFRFCDGTVVEIDGKLLVGRSEDRLKKHVKRLW